MKTSELLLSNTSNQVSVTGEKIRADGWYGSKDGLHTIQITTANFRGRIAIQASLASSPQEDDWFFINLAGSNQYLIYDCAESSTKAYNITGNFVWLRALVDRENLGYEPSPTQLTNLGIVTRIILNR